MEDVQVMKRSNAYILYNALGIALSVLPPACATLSYFPFWIEKGASYAISGTALLLITLSVLPILRIVLSRLKTPSAPMLWLIVFLFFFAMSKIADELTVVAFFGFLGNIIGAVFFRLAKRSSIKDEESS